MLSDLVLMLWVYGGQLVPQQSPSFVQLVCGSMWSSETFLSVFFLPVLAVFGGSAPCR